MVLSAGFMILTLAYCYATSHVHAAVTIIASLNFVGDNVTLGEWKISGVRNRD
jgi:hypothetical protein